MPTGSEVLHKGRWLSASTIKKLYQREAKGRIREGDLLYNDDAVYEVFLYDHKRMLYLIVPTEVLD